MKTSSLYKPGFVPLFCRKILTVFFIQFLGLIPCFSQGSSEYEESRAKLLHVLKSHPIDKAFTENLNRFYFTTCDSLVKTNTTMDGRPVKVILIRLFDASVEKLNNGSITSLRIPSVNSAFLATIQQYKKERISKLYREVGIAQSSILASAFDGIPLGDTLTTYVGLREMVNTPYFISTRLDQPRYSRFRDTLLYHLANSAPEILLKKLEGKDSLFTGLVRRSNNRTVKAISQVKRDIYFDKVLPFSLAILQGRTTAEEVIKLSLTPTEYYKAFIDEVLRLHTSADPQERSFLKQPIAELNKVMAAKYYINEINRLHESPDNVRFQILNSCSVKELYFLLVGGSGELYTSSFLYVYNKFTKDAHQEGLDKFFTRIDYYGFDQFLSNITGYGLVNNLAQLLEDENIAGLIGDYLSGLTDKQLTDNDIILYGMTISDVLNEVKGHEVVRNKLIGQIEKLQNEKTLNDVLLQRMFGGLKNILLGKSEYRTDIAYDKLTVSRLQRKNTIVQACYFYDDDDGVLSFESCTAYYEPGTWDKQDMGNYIVFSSKVGNAMKVYMNKPMTRVGCDTAQDEMLHDIRAQGYEITSYIHRGHSYYLFQSMRKMSPSAQFVFLGSCGGYNEVLNLFRLNPNVNIIATRNIGSVLVNDPLLYRINMNLVNNKDLDWDIIWQEFKTKFQSSKVTEDLFSSYIAPNKYIGVKFIRSVFNY